MARETSLMGTLLRILWGKQWQRFTSGSTLKQMPPLELDSSSAMQGLLGDGWVVGGGGAQPGEGMVQALGWEWTGEHTPEGWVGVKLWGGEGS